MEERPPEPGERVEREVIVERTISGSGTESPRRSPMWAWVIPLVIVALVLMWYVVTRGEPRSLFGESLDASINRVAFVEVKATS